MAVNPLGKKDSIILSGNPAGAVCDLLDLYCGNILACFREPTAILGGVVSMRKALELMGAYGAQYLYREKPVLFLKGEDIFKKGGLKGNQLNIDDNNFLNPAKCLIFGAEGHRGISYLMHYQGYSEKPEERAKKEKEHLLQSHDIFLDAVRDFKIILDSFCDRFHWKSGSIGELLRLPVEATDEMQKEMDMIRKTIEDCDIDPWRDYLASLIHKYIGQDALYPKGGYSVRMLAWDTIAAASRCIAEKSMYRSICEISPENARTVESWSSVTLEDLLQESDKIKRPEGRKASTLWEERRNWVKIIQSTANRDMHWQDEPLESAKMNFNSNLSDDFKNTALRFMRNVLPLIKDLGETPAVRALMGDKELNRRIDDQKKQEKVKKIVIAVASSAATLIVVIAVAFGILLWYSGTDDYAYADYGWQNGAPVGIGALSDEEAAQGLHYVLSYNRKEKQLISIAHVNGNGQIRDEYLLRDRPAVMKLEYSQKNDLLNVRGYSSQDLERELYTLGFSSGKVYFYHPLYQSNEGQTAFTLPLDVTNVDVYTWGEPYQTRTQIDNVTVIHNEDGSVHVSFANLDDERTDSNRISGMTYRYNKDGQIEEITYKYASGTVIDADTLDRRVFVYEDHRLKGYRDYSNEKLLISCKYDYDENGLCVGIRYLNDIEQPVEGVASVTYDYENGQRTGIHYLNKAGLPIASSEGFASQTWRYDEEGRLIEEVYRDVENNLFALNGWAKRIVTYDGTKKLTSYFGADNKAVNITDAGEADYPYAKEQIERNDSTETRIRYNADGLRVLFPGDVFEWRYTYDEFGRETKVEAYGLNEQPVLAEGEYFGYQIDYDANGRKIAQTWYNLDGKTPTKKNIYSYYAASNLRKATTYYTYNLQMKDFQHDYTISITYDNGGNVVAAYCRDASNNLFLHPDNGYAGYNIDYDGKGHWIRAVYFDGDMNPIIIPGKGYAIVQKDYNDNGNCIRTTYYNAEGELTIPAQYGYAVVESKYDESGHETEARYMNEFGQLMLHPKYGYAICNWDYNNGQTIEARFSGVDGKPIYSTYYGFARVCYEYDDAGRRTDTRYYDENGQRMIHPTYGDSWYHQSYDKNGRLLETAHYDTEDHLIYVKRDGYAIQLSHYDQDGNEVERRYLDAEENPIIHPRNGYAVIKMKYENGRLTEEALYDENEHLMVHEDYDCAIRRRTYDDFGNLIQSGFFDTADLPMISEHYGCAGMLSQYDELGREIELRYLDEQGQLMINANEGFAMIRRSFDDAGNENEWRYYDEEECLMLPEGIGAAIIRTEYDVMGNITRQSAYDTNDKLMTREERGYATVIEAYDSIGRLIKWSYYDANGDAAVSIDEGYASCEKEYDKSGNVSRFTFYTSDTYEQLMISSVYGYAMLESDYDDNGRETETRYYDENKHPMVHAEHGYARIKRLYNEEGVLIEEITYDAEYDMNDDTKHRMEHRQYDNNGKLSMNTSYNEDGGYTVYQYNADGNLSTATVYYEGGDYTVYQYGANGMREYWHHYGEDGNLAAIDDWGYAGGHYFQDEAGHTYAEDFYNEENLLFLRRENDADGNALAWIQLMQVYGEDGDYTVYQYDDDGLVEYWHHYDENGDLAAISDMGYAGGHYFKDKAGHTYAEEFYNEEGILFLRRENDDDGNAVEWIRLDAQGNRLDESVE